jgi:hypothetical protein
LSGALVLVAGAVLVGAVMLFVLPRRLLTRAQDRLAREKLAGTGGGESLRLLTRADLVSGRYRRLPGILGLTDDRLLFEGIFGESRELATSRIGKIETGRRLANGRTLLRLEVLRITATASTAGPPLEFVLTPAAAGAWRSHLGLWAMKERQADADRVSPGRS